MTRKSYSSICLSLETCEKLDTLARILNCPKSGLIEKIIAPLYEVGSVYTTAELEAYPFLTRGNAIYQFFGKSNHFAYGKGKPEVGHDD